VTCLYSGEASQRSLYVAIQRWHGGQSWPPT